MNVISDGVAVVGCAGAFLRRSNKSYGSSEPGDDSTMLRTTARASSYVVCHPPQVSTATERDASDKTPRQFSGVHNRVEKHKPNVDQLSYILQDAFRSVLLEQGDLLDLIQERG